ncbi:MAG: hypothetical protein E6J34_24430 [Chloroflexi bacterium]|nr:MAG: hypothetical protein E6J34_24430 [Chloroflexota bacterium]
MTSTGGPGGSRLCVAVTGRSVSHLASEVGQAHGGRRALRFSWLPLRNGVMKCNGGCGVQGLIAAGSVRVLARQSGVFG